MPLPLPPVGLDSTADEPPLPPGTGIAIALAGSLLFWAVIAAILFGAR